MISRGRVIGTLNLGGLRDGAFSPGDVDFLLQVVNQIAIGVENALNYEQVTAHETIGGRTELPDRGDSYGARF